MNAGNYTKCVGVYVGLFSFPTSQQDNWHKKGMVKGESVEKYGKAFKVKKNLIDDSVVVLYKFYDILIFFRDSFSSRKERTKSLSLCHVLSAFFVL